MVWGRFVLIDFQKYSMMKKFLLFLFVCVMVVGITACKKNYICKCKFSVNGMHDINVPVEQVTKSDAEAKCAECEKNYMDGDPEVDCTLQ